MLLDGPALCSVELPSGWRMEDLEGTKLYLSEIKIFNANHL